eukprot:GHVP01070360.1.p1 GENE.GHVP01070360.1~~GHVP01070360.1.p1  ORF type:complete len:621 (+),score=89.15 GHVP01070360.1:774-2636(+)
MFGIVGVIPPLTHIGSGISHLKCTSDGRCLLYGVSTGVVRRMLPEHFDPDYERDPVTVFYGVKKPITAIDVSRDETYVAGGDTDGKITVWKVDKTGTSQEVYDLSMPYVRISEICFSKDGSNLAIGGVDKYGKKLAACITPNGGLPVGTLEGHTIGVASISIRSQKPKRIATAGIDGKLGLHEGPPYKLVNTISLPKGCCFTCVRFSRDGKYLVSTNTEGEVTFWHPLTGELDKSLNVSDEKLNSLSWNDEGNYFATFGNDRYIRIFDSVNCEVLVEKDVTTFVGKQVYGSSILWTPYTNWVAVLVSDGRILGFKWNTKDSTLEDDPGFHWIGPQGYPSVLNYYRPKYRLMVGTSLGAIIFIKQESETCPVLAQKVATTRIRGIVQNEDSIIVLSIDGILREAKIPEAYLSVAPADLDKNQVKKDIENDIKNMAISTRKLDEDQQVQLDFVLTSKLEETPKAFLSVDNDQYCVCISNDGKIVVYPFSTPHSSLDPVWEDLLPAKMILNVDVSADGSLMAVAFVASDDYPLSRFGDERTELSTKYLIELYEIDGIGTPDGFSFKKVLEMHKHEITAISVSSDGCFLASVDATRTVTVIDTNTWRKVATIKKHRSKVTCLAW